VLTRFLGIAAAASFAASALAAPPAPAASSAAPSTAPPSDTSHTLPDPASYSQFPAPVPEPPHTEAPSRRVELGIDGGVGNRPASSGAVHYGVTSAFGFHARIDPLKWLGVRVVVRYESNGVSFDAGALGLPNGTTYDQSALARVYLGAAVEPTWSPVERLGLFAGLGAGWARSTAQELHTSGAEVVELPIRSSVFLEFPLSIGARYEVVRNWVMLSLAGSVGFLSNQDGKMLSSEQTPGKSGQLVTVGGFPEFGTSWNLLAGVGVLL
jgi:opacity protein-like surface antigen